MAMTMLAKDVKTRPIIFGVESVRAILAGAKTQTRRVVKPQSLFEGKDEIVRRFPNQQGCPYGKPGDRLWVRETFTVESNYNIEDERRYPPPHNDGRPVRRVEDAETAYWEQCHYRATDPTPELSYEDGDDDGAEPKCRWKSPLFLPRWASRITLELTSVRVERVQEITREDALAEGVREMFKGKTVELRSERMSLEQHAYAEAWDSLNKARGFGWDTNPFCWVLTFAALRATPER